MTGPTRTFKPSRRRQRTVSFQNLLEMKTQKLGLNRDNRASLKPSTNKLRKTLSTKILSKLGQVRSNHRPKSHSFSRVMLAEIHRHQSKIGVKRLPARLHMKARLCVVSMPGPLRCTVPPSKQLTKGNRAQSKSRLAKQLVMANMIEQDKTCSLYGGSKKKALTSRAILNWI